MSISAKAIYMAGGVLLVGLVLADGASAQGEYGGPYPFGTTATPAEIAAWDTDVMADGRGMPAGAGTYEEGKELYAQMCAFCHGEDLGGGPTDLELVAPIRRGAALIGGRGTLNTDSPLKTVESYWPYASTLFDFIKRAMPMASPGVLTDDQVYALSAFILGEAKIIEQSQVMNADTLWRVKMPNRNGFFPDDRPEPVQYD